MVTRFSWNPLMLLLHPTTTFTAHVLKILSCVVVSTFSRQIFGKFVLEKKLPLFFKFPGHLSDIPETSRPSGV